MNTALEGLEGSASRPCCSLPPRKTRYPLYRRLGGPQGRSGQVRKNSPPPGFDPRTFQPVASQYTEYATRPILCSTLFSYVPFCTEQQQWWLNSNVTGLARGVRNNIFLFPVGARYFYLCRNVQTGCRVQGFILDVHEQICRGPQNVVRYWHDGNIALRMRSNREGNVPEFILPIWFCASPVSSLFWCSLQSYIYIFTFVCDRGGTVGNVLCYKSEGHWFDSRWCHWNFSLT